MSETTNGDLARQIARVIRSNEETQKFVAEQKKLMAEAAQLDRDRSLAPWQIAAGGAVAGVALVGAGIAFAKLFLP